MPYVVASYFSTFRTDTYTFEIFFTQISSCYATFDRGLAQAEKVGVRGVGSIKFICVPVEHSAFIKKKQKKKMILNKMKIKLKLKLICVLVGGLWRRESS
jgi:hypothetical protein